LPRKWWESHCSMFSLERLGLISRRFISRDYYPFASPVVRVE
jgi:hypothetical protein